MITAPRNAFSLPPLLIAQALLLGFVGYNGLAAWSATPQDTPSSTAPQPDGRIIPTEWHDPQVPQEIGGAFWRVDHSFQATIRIKNSVQIAPVTVVPVLYMADGTPYRLAAVKLDPAGVAAVNINAALSSAPRQLLPHISEFGSASLEYTWSWNTAIGASIENLDVPRSLIFNFFFAPVLGSMPLNKRKEGDLQRIEGMWWKYDPETVGFLALTNVSQGRIKVSVQFGDATGDGHQRILQLRPQTTERLLVDEEWAGFQRSDLKEGGVTIAYNGERGSVIAAGGMENPATGYSAKLTFSTTPANRVQPSLRSYASAGIMVGKPDPMMSFPSDTSFEPYALLRNTTARALTVTPAVHWMNASGSGTATLPGQRLSANETRRLDLETMLSAVGLKAFSGDIVLTLASEIAPGELLIGTGSVDRSGTYVFEVIPKPVASNEGRDICYWNVADGTDSMITLWNFGDQPEDLIVTLHYSSGAYKLRKSLAGGAFTMIGVADLVRMHMPDEEGHFLPPDVREGSADVVSAKAPTETVHLVLSAATFNVRTATCGDVCDSCNGYTSYWIQVVPASLAVSSTYQLHAKAQTHQGYVDEYTSSSSWSSSNTSVSTISAGLTNGVAVGSFTASAFINLPPSNQMCWDNYYTCDPIPYSGQGPGYVGPYRVEPIATASQYPPSICSQGQTGWQRNVTNQLQYSNGSPYAHAGITTADNFSIGSRNDLRITSVSPGSDVTTGDGSWSDFYFVCSSACPASTGETDALQNWTANGLPLPHVNLVIYKCSSISIDGY